MSNQKFYYDNSLVKAFTVATLIWGVIAFILGVTVAALFRWPTIPEALFGTNLKDTLGMMGFGRLRMLHTSGAIFAFVGNSVFAGVYYSLPRLLKTPMNKTIGWINFWGWQLMIVLVVVTFFLGINTSKEYAEHEWPIDILIAVIWVLFGVNMMITIAKRRESHLYVAIWFYFATWLGVAMLHIFNNLEVPLTLTKSYSAYAGVQDALVQWWYGHNAVAFFLTTPVLGLMYYYLPKAANRPVFSYKLSIIHFWSLIFVYIWAGTHHLIYTALPGWAQALGTAFSIMLIAPSWGGMLNGLLTLRGAWDKVRVDPILKMFVVAVTCYGMATFEGPLLATKMVNKVGHFTDWVIAHVHVGTLGWNGMMAFGIAYWIIPRIYRTKLHSVSLANTHFWLATLGIVFYVIPMYMSGFTQGMMWKQFTPEGQLEYSNWVAILDNLKIYYFLRFIGGSLYLIGAILWVYNLTVTMRKGSLLKLEEAEAPALQMNPKRKPGEKFHPWLERTPAVLYILCFISLIIGGMVEIIPMITDAKNQVPEIASVKPYTPLELEGRDLYIREGCNACHSQMVRPFRDEIERFKGDYSKPGEFVYDRPFLWGSKRTGPDLHRLGGHDVTTRKYDDTWHYTHLLDPRATSPGSIMPAYPWLFGSELDKSLTQDKIALMKNAFDVPYTDKEVENADKLRDQQAKEIAEGLMKNANIAKDLERRKKTNPDAYVPLEDQEIVAMIAYLQRLGADTKVNDVALNK